MRGSRTNLLNYRPVSLTSVPCKIMEKILRGDIVAHLESNNLLKNHQHGFRGIKILLNATARILGAIRNYGERRGQCRSCISWLSESVWHCSSQASHCITESSRGGGEISRWIQNFRETAGRVYLSEGTVRIGWMSVAKFMCICLCLYAASLESVWCGLLWCGSLWAEL